MNYFHILGWLFYFFYMIDIYANTVKPTSTDDSKSVKQQYPSSFSSNPAAVNVGTGAGVLQKYMEKKLDIHDNHGISVQGAWIGDTNSLFGGEYLMQKTPLQIVDLTIDMERFNGWRGGLFSAQFLQENAQNTNGQAGVIQGFNSVPDVPPYNRSELYALWYRQSLFDDKLFIRIGKTITTLDFNNVVKPVPLNQDDPNIPAVTSLIYTPVFISPAVDGLMPGYTNTAYGITTTFIPTKTWYASYGIYDGNLASGKTNWAIWPYF